MKKLLFAVAVLASFLSSCGDDEIVLDPDALGTAYYPLEVGAFKVFNVLETTYEQNVATVASFQTRETIKGAYQDQAGKEWFTVEVGRRDGSAGAWRVVGVKAVSKNMVNANSGSLLVQENNRTVVNMVYPLREGKRWNPNAFNAAYHVGDPGLQEAYWYEDLGQPYESGGKSYSNTVTIVKGEPAPIDYQQEREVLAKDLGTVFRESIKRYYCDGSAGSNCELGSGYVISGVDRIETLESTGKIEL